MGNYIGSVRFFKNLILLFVLVLIAVPCALCFHWKEQLNQTQQTLAQLEADSAEMTSQLMDLTLAHTLSCEEPAPEQARVLETETPSYQSLYPDFYSPEPIPDGVRTDGVIYLTFDDGPSARTAEILEILKEENIKATFFVVGFDDAQSRQWLRDIVDQGHTLAMHSYTHDFASIYSSVEAYLDDMYRLFTLIKETTGVTPTLFRCPGGSINSYNYGLYQEIMAEMIRRGFIPHDWNLTNQDTLGVKLSVDTLISNVVDGAAQVSRGVVLMHDAAGKHNTVAALLPTIEQLRAMGFEFDRLTPEVTPILFSYVP